MSNKKLERHLLFIGNIYYPGRGLEDLCGCYNSEEAAIAEIFDKTSEKNRDLEGIRAWSHVYNLENSCHCRFFEKNHDNVWKEVTHLTPQFDWSIVSIDNKE